MFATRHEGAIQPGHALDKGAHCREDPYSVFYIALQRCIMGLERGDQLVAQLERDAHQKSQDDAETKGVAGNFARIDLGAAAERPAERETNGQLHSESDQLRRLHDVEQNQVRRLLVHVLAHPLLHQLRLLLRHEVERLHQHRGDA